MEFLFPYEHPAAEIRARLDATGLEQVLFNAPPGDWAAGERGTASLPGRQAEFRDGIKRALDYADGARQPAGARAWPASRAGTCRPATAAALYAANLAWAAEQAHAAGVKLVIEPINHRDMPGFLLNTMAQGAAVVEAIGRDRLGLQFDVYHCQVTEGDMTKRMEALHAGDRPHADRRRAGPQRARHRRDRLGVRVRARSTRSGYAGWVGCEYRPRGRHRRRACVARALSAFKEIARSRSKTISFRIS